MIKTICVMFLSAGVSFVSAQTTTTAPTPSVTAKTSKAKKKTTSAATPPLKIPAGAVRTAQGAYRYTDPHGKVWLYNDTPFGVSRIAESESIAHGTAAAPSQTPFGAPAASPGASTDPNENITAVADGDTVHFQKPTPFGPTNWQKNKSDLTPEEQRIWQREEAKRNK